MFPKKSMISPFTIRTRESKSSGDEEAPCRSWAHKETLAAFLVCGPPMRAHPILKSRAFGNFRRPCEAPHRAGGCHFTPADAVRKEFSRRSAFRPELLSRRSAVY